MGAETNQRIGDYEVLGVLGSGGMGKVYRVRNLISDRVEAMKVLLPDLAGRQELAARFLREIKMLASLNHPNIATLCTALTVDNQLIMIMEYVEGVTLDELLTQRQISIEEATNYISQVLSALSYAHEKGVIHRDIKPANMMLTATGTVKLMDFGIARSATERSMTQTGTTLGSVNYMSPEQITGQAVDARSDIYSTGVSLYEVVTGQRPFSATSDYELMAMHVKEAPRPPIELQPWLPSALNHIILMAIAKDPNERFQSAEAFRHALASTQAAVPTGAIPAAPVRAATMVEMARPAIPPTSLASTAPARGGTQVATWNSGAQVVAQPAQPAALAQRMPPASSPKKLYIAGGAVLALAAIGVPAFRIMNHKDASAKTETVSSGDSGGQINPVPVVNPAPAQPVALPPAPTIKATAKIAVARPPYQPPQPPPAETKQAPPEMSAELQRQLDNLETRIDKDSNRASAINNSLNTMQSQMQKDGMSLRGDVSEQQSSMNNNLAKAQKALEARDADRADRFAGMAETDIAQLQRFLGH